MRCRVLVIHDALVGWGSEKNLANIGRFAPAGEVEVSYLITGGQGAAEAASAAGVTAFFLGGRRLRVNRYTQAVNFVGKAARAMAWLWRRRYGFDVMIVSNPEECVIADLARRLLRLPARLVVYCQIPLAPETQNPFLRRLLRRQVSIMRRCDGVICLSEGLRRHLARDHSIAVPMWVLPSCIDPAEVAALARDAIAESWLDDSRRTLIWVGRLSNWQKRTDVFLRAVAELRHQHGRVDFKAILIGDGEDRQALQDLAKSLRVDDCAHFLGYRRNPYPYYAMADVFVLSSDVEGFGNVIVEAMASGLPVIATDCESGPREILGGGRWGMLVPPGDHDAMATEIARLLDDEPRRLDLRRKSLERSASFGCGRVFDAFAGICAQLAGAARTRVA